MSTTSYPNDTPFTPGTILRSDSGKSYDIREVLLDRRGPLLCVYRASAEGKEFIVKNMIPGDFEYQMDLQKAVAMSPHVRTVVDSILERGIFIYPFLAGDLLRSSRMCLSDKTRKEILRNALHGLADLHKRDILHSDIKPNNILLDYEEVAGGEITIKRVQISDLEDAVIVPPGKYLKGPLCGNQMWRSPESWARSRQNQASDIFSFAIVMIYVVINKMVFQVSNEQLEAEDSWRHIFRRHISYFGDEEGFVGFLNHIGQENPFYGRVISLANDFPPENGREPFALWTAVDSDFRDLIGKMTSLDPARRITAQEALSHRWFS